MILGLPAAALGAVIAALIAGMVSLAAALIAGLISLLGLIVSKEQKTSEFRQAWIDSLRGDLSTYLTCINAAQDAYRLIYNSDSAKLKAMQPHYLELNKAIFNILLRLNPKEALSRDVLNCLGEFNKLSRDPNTLTLENIRPIQASMLVASQELLKSEWKRVKAGELTFKVAKGLALLVVLVAISAGGWFVVQASRSLPRLSAAALSSTRATQVAEKGASVKISPGGDASLANPNGPQKPAGDSSVRPTGNTKPDTPNAPAGVANSIVPSGHPVPDRAPQTGKHP